MSERDAVNLRRITKGDKMNCLEAVKKLKLDDKKVSLAEVLKAYSDRYTLIADGFQDWNGSVKPISDMENLNTQY